jgi:DNA-binding IclR family transcriptional regulator
MPSPLTDISARATAGSVIAEGRVLDAVARRDLAGTIDEIADALGIVHAELRPAIDELVSIGWVSLELMAEKLVLSLPEDARAAS